ncbi:hypothetical protein EV421DRAFT_1740005 [Armillaria borealis]|uniref:Uncharacterized protein n=1 Tax=Armillaria borealis TaxID=47425 RepID=A0AA39J462_9AGAR|nr:hypothetical protein EV421DRAFT_1740005 [Armillaria borealis]
MTAPQPKMINDERVVYILASLMVALSGCPEYWSRPALFVAERRSKTDTAPETGIQNGRQFDIQVILPDDVDDEPPPMTDDDIPSSTAVARSHARPNLDSHTLTYCDLIRKDHETGPWIQLFEFQAPRNTDLPKYIPVQLFLQCLAVFLRDVCDIARYEPLSTISTGSDISTREGSYESPLPAFNVQRSKSRLWIYCFLVDLSTLHAIRSVWPSHIRKYCCHPLSADASRTTSLSGILLLAAADEDNGSTITIFCGVSRVARPHFYPRIISGKCYHAALANKVSPLGCEDVRSAITFLGSSARTYVPATSLLDRI